MKNEPYKLELQAEKFLKSLTWLVYALGKYLTTIPKNKMDKIPWLLEILSFVGLGVALILRYKGY